MLLTFLFLTFKNKKATVVPERYATRCIENEKEMKEYKGTVIFLSNQYLSVMLST